MLLDDAVLAEVIEWGRDLEGFERDHAINGLTCVQGYADGAIDEHGELVPGIGRPPSDRFTVFALQLAWIFWLDDRFDARSSPSSSPIDVEAIIHARSRGPSTPEAEGYLRLLARIERLSPSEPALQSWKDACAATIRAWHEEARLASNQRTMSYAEYIDNGERSSTIEQIVAAASLVYGFDMRRIFERPASRRLLRDLSMICRLHNDLQSLDKERREGGRANDAVIANAVAVVERLTSPRSALAFVEHDLRGYRAMLQEDFDALGHDDILCRLARAMLASHDNLYRLATARYRATA